MTFSAENLQACEDFLVNNQFLSGKDLPGVEDMAVLEGLNAKGTVPDFEQFSNVFGWFWTLNQLAPPARDLYKTGAADAKPKKAAAKKEEKKAEPKKADDEDDFDPFADETEEDKQAADNLVKKQEEDKAAAKKKAKPAVIAKSSVCFDVKGYESDADWDAMATKIRQIKMDGLVWMDTHNIVEIAFGMKKLRMTMLIEDEKIQTDDVFELIEAWEEEVQSVDIAAMAKA